MIVVSAALVVVAVLLLVLGLAAGLAFVYASIVASLLAVGALAVGVVQRHTGARSGGGGGAASQAPGAGPPRPVAQPGAQPAVRPGAPARTAVQPGDPEAGQPGAPDAGAEDVGHPRPAPPGPGGGPDAPAGPAPVVHVVAGRPRYHLPECRYLQDRTAEQLPVGQARARGFTPCGICHPERALDPSAAGPAPEPDGREAEPARPAASVVVPSADGHLHRPTCPLVVGALATEARTRDEAIGDGASPCPLCRP